MAVIQTTQTKTLQQILAVVIFRVFVHLFLFAVLSNKHKSIALIIASVVKVNRQCFCSPLFFFSFFNSFQLQVSVSAQFVGLFSSLLLFLFYFCFVFVVA